MSGTEELQNKEFAFKKALEEFEQNVITEKYCGHGLSEVLVDLMRLRHPAS